MRRQILTAAAMGALLVGAGPAAAETVTIATVNNGDMIVMQKLSSAFEEQHPDIELEWVVLEENVLRQRATTDIATQGGQFNVMTIGTYEVPIWAAQGWLEPMEGLPEDYDLDDVVKPVRDGLSYEGQLYALPFYAESSMLFYRTDLFEQAGIEVPEQPQWPEVRQWAEQLHDPDNGVYGICLRGKPGWGENMAFVTTLVNTFGGQWFNTDWEPQLNSEPWQEAVTFYVDLLNNYGPPGASSNGFNENLALFSTGKCAMWIDATVAAGMLFNPAQSPGRRQARLRAGAGREASEGGELAVVVGARRSHVVGCQGCGEDLRHLGHLEGLHRAGGRAAGLGRSTTRDQELDLRAGRVPGSGTVRELRSRGDRDRRPGEHDGGSQALQRGADRGFLMRRDPRPADVLALRLGARHAGLDPLGNECALELGETGHDAEDRL